MRSNATNRNATRTAHPRLRSCLLASLSALTAALALLLAVAPPRAHAQRPVDLAFTYSQERTKFVGSSTNDYFRLRGASVNAGTSLWHGLGVFADASGFSSTNQRYVIDIHQATFVVGPRYTYNWGHITPTAWNRHSGVYFEGGVGYTIATSGYYPTGGQLSDHASALSYQAGGGINLHLYHRLDLRLVEADIIQTKLPNGGNNTQNNIRYATGLNFHLGN
jgi:hypothetical protein